MRHNLLAILGFAIILGCGVPEGATNPTTDKTFDVIKAIEFVGKASAKIEEDSRYQYLEENPLKNVSISDVIGYTLTSDNTVATIYINYAKLLSKNRGVGLAGLTDNLLPYFTLQFTMLIDNNGTKKWYYRPSDEQYDISGVNQRMYFFLGPIY